MKQLPHALRCRVLRLMKQSSAPRLQTASASKSRTPSCAALRQEALLRRDQAALHSAGIRSERQLQSEITTACSQLYAI